jgi:O-antigen ligase
MTHAITVDSAQQPGDDSGLEPVVPASGQRPAGAESAVDRLILFLIVLLIPTIPFDAFRIPTNSFLLPYAALAVAMLAYWGLISFKTPFLPSRTSRRSAIIVMLFGAWATLSLVWSQAPQLSHLLALMFYLTSSAAIISFNRITGSTLHKASTLLLILMTLMVIYGLYMLATGKSDWFQFAQPQPDSVQLGTRNSDAFMVATVFPLALVRALVSGVSKRVRLFAAVAGALSIAAVLLSLSRSSTVGIAVAAVITVFVGRHLIPVRPRTILATGLLLVAAFFVLHNYFGDQELSFARFQTVDQSSRIPLARTAYDLGMDHPLTGVGYFEFPSLNPYGEDAHDAYLNLFAELGLPGLLLFTLFLIVPLYRFLVLARRFRGLRLDVMTRTLYLQGLGMLVTVALLAATDTFYKSIYFWIIYVFAVMHLGWLECKIMPRDSSLAWAQAQ